MENVFLTICIPCRNGEMFLRRSVGALQLDNLDAIECVVADNASVDGTPAICEELAARHENFSFKRFDEFTDAIGNFNRCCDLVRGEFLVFLPVDDVLFGERLVEAVGFLRAHRDVDFLCCSILGISPEGRVFPMRVGDGLMEPIIDARRDFGLADSMLGGGVSLLGLVMRRSLLESVGRFNGEFELFTELMFPFLLSRKGTFAGYDRFLGAFINRKDSSYSSSRPDFLEQAIKKVFSSQLALDMIRDYPRMYRTLLFDMIRGHFRSGPLRLDQVWRCFRVFWKNTGDLPGLCSFGAMAVSSGPMARIFYPLYQWWRSRKWKGSWRIEEEDLGLLRKCGISIERN